jgi:hypothetical protein
LLVVRPAALGVLDVPLLTLLRATAQQNHQALTVPPEIHAVARTPVNPALQHAGTDRLDLRQIALRHARQHHGHLGRRPKVKLVEPDLERLAPRQVPVGDELEHCLRHGLE